MSNIAVISEASQANQASICLLRQASICLLANEVSEQRPSVTLQLENMLQALATV